MSIVIVMERAISYSRKISATAVRRSRLELNYYKIEIVSS